MFDEFFQSAGDREPQMRALDDFIRVHAPDLEPSEVPGMFGKMLGYGLMPYQTKSMKEPGEWPLLAIAAQKNHISIYACVAIDGKYIAEVYEPRLGKVNTGKSCIRFKKFDDVDKDGLRQLLTDINSRYLAGEKLYGL